MLEKNDLSAKHEEPIKLKKSKFGKMDWRELMKLFNVEQYDGFECTEITVCNYMINYEMIEED